MAIPSYLPQQANIRAYYSLEDVNDGSANGYNLTNFNSVTFTSAKFRNGANLGSSNSNKYLRVDNTLGINGGVCTISTWVKNLAEISSGGWCFALCGGGTTHVFYVIGYEYNSGTRRVAFSRYKDGGANQAAYYNTTMGTSNFYNLVLTYDNTNIRGYINGSLVAGPTAASGSGTGTATYSGVGYFYFNYTYSFASSLIDETVFWDKCLSIEEIVQVYKGPIIKGGIAIGSPMIF